MNMQKWSNSGGRLGRSIRGVLALVLLASALPAAAHAKAKAEFIIENRLEGYKIIAKARIYDDEKTADTSDVTHYKTVSAGSYSQPRKKTIQIRFHNCKTETKTKSGPFYLQTRSVKSGELIDIFSMQVTLTTYSLLAGTTGYASCKKTIKLSGETSTGRKVTVNKNGTSIKIIVGRQP